MPIIVDNKKLSTFTKNVFKTFKVPDEDAHICADNLVLADLRGIPSHGVARLKRYVDGMLTGVIFPSTKPEIINDTPSAATVDGNGGLGQVVGYFSTNLAIDKAKKTGIGIVTVRNSNHYGIAGYYSQMVLNEGMIGVSLTNTAPLVVPTFGREMMFGTNAMSFAAPAKRNRPFFLDMATSVVPRGKLEVFDRAEKDMPEGWAVDSNGEVATNASKVLKNMLKRLGGGILPLGGEGEVFSGHKGYGLAIIIDILCGVLSGGAYADIVNMKKDGKPAPANVSHFFMALKIENFIDMDTFTTKMDDLIDRLKNSAKAKNQERIFIHGEKEYEMYDKHIKEGIPIQEKVYNTLKVIAQDRQVDFDI